MNILIVDDYKTMLRIIENLLKQLGFKNVFQVADGTAALKTMRESGISLVISDWNMEPMTGLQLLKEVRADSALEATPFIMITAERKTENVVAAKAAGVNNYIIKPFNAETLKNKLTAVIGAFYSSLGIVCYDRHFRFTRPAVSRLVKRGLPLNLRHCQLKSSRLSSNMFYHL